MDDEGLTMTGLAPYAWGSLVLESGTATPRQVRVLGRVIDELRGGSVPAGSPEQVRTALAALRELARLQQDLTTGMGAWDHVCTRIAYLRLAGQSRWFFGPRDDPPYAHLVAQMLDPAGVSAFTKEVRGDLAAIREETVALRRLRSGQRLPPGSAGSTPTPTTSAGGSGPLSEPAPAPAPNTPQAAMNDGPTPTASPVGHAQDLDLSALLELDALCAAFDALATTQRPPNAQAWLDDHARLWWLPGAAPAQALVLRQVAESIGLPAPTVDPSMGTLRAVAAVTAWLVDLACAHPAPGHLTALPDDTRSFDPVERFTAGLAALTRLDPEQVLTVRGSVLGGRRRDAEAVLATAMETPYLSSTTIYEHWVEELQPLARSDEWDAPLFRLRLAAIQARLEEDPVRGPQALMHAGTAVHAMVEGVGMVALTDIEETSTLAALRRALMDRRFDMEIFELVHGDAVFRCPYARATPCPGRRQVCVTGIEHLRDLPSADVCEARRSLVAAGWELPPAVAVGPAPPRRPRARDMLPMRGLRPSGRRA